MAHLIPILQDIIPMIRPGKVQVIRPVDFDQEAGQTDGMSRFGAIVDMSSQLCASDTIVYAASGYGTIITNPSLMPPPPNMPSTTVTVSSPSVRAINVNTKPIVDPNGRADTALANISSHLDSATTESSSALASIPTTISNMEPHISIQSSNFSPLPSPDKSNLNSQLTTTNSSASPLRTISPNPMTTLPTTQLTAPSSMISHPIQFPHRHLKAHMLSPGDFAFIPAWTEHQEVNDSDEDVVWIITRGGSVPAAVNLEGWGGKEMR